MTSKIPEPWATAMRNVNIPSYRRLAQKAGLSVGTVHVAHKGQRQCVAPATIAGLATALRISEETISEYSGMGRQQVRTYKPPQEATILTKRERDHVDELIRLLVASRAKPAVLGKTRLGDARLGDEVNQYVHEADAKLKTVEQSDVAPVARKHEDRED